jgi:hypothetical protein
MHTGTRAQLRPRSDSAEPDGDTTLDKNTVTDVADSDRHFGHRHALSQDFRRLTDHLLISALRT